MKLKESNISPLGLEHLNPLESLLARLMENQKLSFSGSKHSSAHGAWRTEEVTTSKGLRITVFLSDRAHVT